MCTLLIALNVLLSSYVICSLIIGGDAGGEFRFYTTFYGAILSTVFWILSFVMPIGDKIHTTKPATNSRVGDVLVIQADGFPVQLTQNMAFIDKKVQIMEIQPTNAWGNKLEVGITYEIQLIKTEVE